MEQMTTIVCDFLLKILCILLLDLHRVSGHRMVECRLHTVDRLILVKHLVRIPTVRVAVQLQANVIPVGTVPWFQLLLLVPRRRTVAACRNRRVGRQRVARRVLQIDVLGDDTDNVARLKDEHVGYRIDGNLGHTDQSGRGINAVVRRTAGSAVLCAGAIAMCCGVMMIATTAAAAANTVQCGIGRALHAVGHLEGDMETGRKCAIDTFVGATG